MKWDARRRADYFALIVAPDRGVLCGSPILVRTESCLGRGRLPDRLQEAPALIVIDRQA